MPDVLDVNELGDRATRAAQTWAPGCTIDDVTFLPGGSVSIVYTGRVHGGPSGIDTVVLKVAPPGLVPRRNRDVLRQARCIEALSRVPGVAVPHVLFGDEGAPVEVPPFFATPMLAGECVEPLLVVGRQALDESVVRTAPSPPSTCWWPCARHPRRHRVGRRAAHHTRRRGAPLGPHLRDDHRRLPHGVRGGGRGAAGVGPRSPGAARGAR